VPSTLFLTGSPEPFWTYLPSSAYAEVAIVAAIMAAMLILVIFFRVIVISLSLVLSLDC
jgi:hypothetical protein